MPMPHGLPSPDGLPPARAAAPADLRFDFTSLIDADGEVSRFQFGHAGYLPLPGLVPAAALAALRAEVDALLTRAKRRDFQMECMGGTPRHMTTLGGIEIARMAPAIVSLYHDRYLLSMLGEHTGLTLQYADDPVERHVLNVLHRSGDTHGLHTDDYPLALVIFVESPTCATGCGELEFHAPSCPGRNEGESVVKTHRAGDAYLLRADQHPHRVRPIHDGCTRTVLNFAYGATSIPVNPTPSASLLYS